MIESIGSWQAFINKFSGISIRSPSSSSLSFLSVFVIVPSPTCNSQFANYLSWFLLWSSRLSFCNLMFVSSLNTLHSCQRWDCVIVAFMISVLFPYLITGKICRNSPPNNIVLPPKAVVDASGFLSARRSYKVLFNVQNNSDESLGLHPKQLKQFLQSIVLAMSACLFYI